MESDARRWREIGAAMWSRRAFLTALSAAPLVTAARGRAARVPPAAHASERERGEPRPPSTPPPVRAVTAGVTLRSSADADTIGAALELLSSCRARLEAAGRTVQTVRVCTQPVLEYADDLDDEALGAIRAFDELSRPHGAVLSVGPLRTAGLDSERVAAWAADLARATESVSFSIPVSGQSEDEARAAAETIVALADARPRGEANFRFAAACGIPPETPFFPVAWHEGPPALAFGLESAGVVAEAFAEAAGWEAAIALLRERLAAELGPVEAIATDLAGELGWRYAGIDVSPAPSLESSIGGAVEALTGSPFGAPATLRACAAITEVLRELPVRRCGYSGLMLPVLEDEVLAQRASEGRYGVQDVLLYSAVCGTGLDVIPLPGDVAPSVLAELIGDVATLSRRLQKPLAARLLPIPGAAAGDRVAFDNPHLTSCSVMAAG